MEEKEIQQAEERAKEFFKGINSFKQLSDYELFQKGFLDCYEVNKVEELKAKVEMLEDKLTNIDKELNQANAQIAKLREMLSKSKELFDYQEDIGCDDWYDVEVGIWLKKLEQELKRNRMKCQELVK